MVVADDGGAREVVVPHVDVIALSIRLVAVAAGLTAVFVERGGEVAGVAPVATETGRGDRGGDFDVADPTLAALVGAESPLEITVFGAEDFSVGGADESGLIIIFIGFVVKIGRVGIENAEGVRGDFVATVRIVGEFWGFSDLAVVITD